MEGEAGNFSVTVTTAPRYIDLNKCTACGDCFKKYPECVRFTPGLDHRAPTCMRYPQATPQAFSIDLEKCQDVEGLVRVCPAGAIVTDDAEKTGRIACGSIVLAPGAALFDPSGLDNIGYRDQPDVVTSLEYERILSASGPTLGQLVRPSDGRQPQKIAWIQCVGSRGLQHGAASYCSSVCCMFALKEAIVTKERFRESIETTIFYMDMRTFGKDYERYLERAKNDYGVRLVRCRPHSVVRHAGAETLSVSYVLQDSGLPKEEDFDLVVLSTGFRVAEDVRQLAVDLGLELNAHAFRQDRKLQSRGHLPTGDLCLRSFRKPEGYPGNHGAGQRRRLYGRGQSAGFQARGRSGRPFPPERDVTGEAPRIGVFVCDCGYNIGGVIDVDTLAEAARALPQVAISEAVGHGCSRESLEHIQAGHSGRGAQPGGDRRLFTPDP